MDFKASARPGRLRVGSRASVDRRANALLLSLALVILLGMAFGPHLRGDWVWDDVYLVEQNPSLHDPHGLRVLLTHDLWGGAGHRATDLYHPVPMAWLWLVSRIAGR